MARVTFATAFGHPLGVQQRLTSAFVPHRGSVPPILFDLAFVRDFASFGAAEGRIYFFSAQKRRNGTSDIRNCFWTPLGVQQRLTSAFVPYRGVVPPILFHLAFVRDFASFGAAERRMR